MNKQMNLLIFPAPTDLTQLSQLVNPQVLAPIVSYKLQKALRFTPLAEVDTTLVGSPGNTITFPAFGYIGDAQDIVEGETIPYEKLTTTTKQATVKKAGIGVKVSDEAALSGYGDPIGEATSQIALSIANKVDNDLLTAAKTATQTVSVEPTVDGVQGILDMFDDEDAKAYVLVVNNKTAAKLRKSANTEKIGSDVGANALIEGTYADILGMQIVRSKKLGENEAIAFKVNDDKPVLKLVMKRGVQVESERDIDIKAYKLNGDEHYTAYVYDESKIVKVTFTTTTPPTTP